MTRFLARIRIRVNRGELSGAFGDLGTDLPLLTGMILASGMHPASVLTIFGLAQVGSAFFYGIPMPVQPLKAVAALVIAGGISASQVYGAGLSIGLIMLVLTASGMLNRLRAIIPRGVIRGIQLGLGGKLTLLALTRYIPSDGAAGLVLAGACALVVVLLLNNRRCPPALPVVGIGLVYALCFKFGDGTWSQSFGVALPQLARFSAADVLQGTLILALPQIPLSLGNSLFATHQMASDLFPERKVKLRTIGYTYSALNILIPFVGGIPVCHGSGGMAGHYVFGGRTGGSVLIYGLILISFGVFFGGGFERVVQIFPLPVLGVILVTEGVMLMRFMRDTVPDRFALATALLTAACAVLLPSGFLVGMIAGTGMAYAPQAWRSLKQATVTPIVPEESDA
jgi:hypothetical protein